MAEVTCAVCGKQIAKNESRYVDVQAGTNVKVLGLPRFCGQVSAFGSLLQ
jgi:hypothetical protein